MIIMLGIISSCGS